MNMLDDQSMGARAGLGVGGFIFLAIAGLALLWMYPEMKRYLRIRRM